MQVKLYRSATLGIHFENYKIIQDPWLTEGEYYGSWYHYPPFDINNSINEINSYDAIYISHIHPDHCSEKTLKYINKKIPIYIANYHAKFLKLKLQNLGFQVFEIKHGQRCKLANNVYLSIYAADNCDPNLCYKFTGCGITETENSTQFIDSISVLDDNKKHVLVNVNDSPFELAQVACKKIKQEYGKIDVLFTGYSGAGPYPQCFDNLSIQNKIIEGEKKKINFLNQAKNYIELFETKYYLPFAGTYLLSGKLSNLNDYRGVAKIDEAYDYLQKNNTKSIPIKINYGDTFDIINGKSTKKYFRQDPKIIKKYIDENLSKIKLDYEKDKPTLSNDDLFVLAKKAFERYIMKKNLLKANYKTNIIINLGDFYFEICNSLKKETILMKKKSGKIFSSEPHVIYTLDRNLLEKILYGPKFAHWNNAEIGSHINFYRQPDVYERNVYETMCFFHS